jgi:hydroxyacylglutathione hydrolase
VGVNRAIPVSLGMVKVFILAGNRPVLVDTGTAGNARRILAGLKRHGIDPSAIGLVLITHTHGDHIGSLADINRIVRAPVAVHRLDADSLRRGSGVEPDILLEDDFDLRQYGVAGKVIWTPGHSRGSVSVMLESGEAVVGDLVLPRFMAFGPPAIAFWSASREDSIASIRKVLALKPSVILTSHGGPYDPGSLTRLTR